MVVVVVDLWMVFAMKSHLYQCSNNKYPQFLIEPLPIHQEEKQMMEVGPM